MDTPDDTSPVSMRIRLKYPDTDTFIRKYSANISQGGMFIQSRAPQPVETTIRFEMVLQDGTPLLKGEGRVIWIKEYDASQPNKVHGMGVRFIEIDEQSEALVTKILAYKQSESQPRLTSTHTQEVKNLIQAVAHAESEEPEEVEDEPADPVVASVSPPKDLTAVPKPTRSWMVQGPRSSSQSLATVPRPRTTALRLPSIPGPLSDQGRSPEEPGIVTAKPPATGVDTSPAAHPSPSLPPSGSNGIDVAIATAEEMLLELLKESSLTEKRVLHVLSLILAGSFDPEGAGLEELEELLRHEAPTVISSQEAAQALERMFGTPIPTPVTGLKSASSHDEQEKIPAANRTTDKVRESEAHSFDTSDEEHAEVNELDADASTDERGDDVQRDALGMDKRRGEDHLRTVATSGIGGDWSAAEVTAEQDFKGDEQALHELAQQVQEHTFSDAGLVEFEQPVAGDLNFEDGLDPETDPHIQALPSPVDREDPAETLSKEVWQEVIQEATSIADPPQTEDTVQESIGNFDQTNVTFQVDEGRESLPVDRNMLFGGNLDVDHTAVTDDRPEVDPLLQKDDTLPPDPELQHQIFEDLAAAVEPPGLNETIPSLESLADYNYDPNLENTSAQEEEISIKPRKSGLFDRIFGKKD